MRTARFCHSFVAIFCLLLASCAEKEPSGYKRKAVLPPEFLASSNTHFIPGTDLEMRIPKDWKQISHPEIIFAFSEPCEDTVQFCSNVVVNLISKREYISPDRLTAIAKSAIEQNLRKWDVEIVGESLVSINSLDGCIVEYMADVNGIKVAGLSVTFLYINKVLSLNFASSDYHYLGEYQDRRKIFENICKSVCVKEN